MKLKLFPDGDIEQGFNSLCEVDEMGSFGVFSLVEHRQRATFGEQFEPWKEKELKRRAKVSLQKCDTV